jgi:RNA polymerase sigma-70 factor (ECF subfamily)
MTVRFAPADSPLPASAPKLRANVNHFSEGFGTGEIIMSWNEIVTLVERARDGDRSAYGELVQRFEATVYAVALTRLRNPVEAQELAQEVFIHAWTKLDQLRDPQCLPGWLRQITVRMALNRLTRRGPLRGAEAGVLESVPAGGDSPLDEMVRQEQRKALLDGLDQLKPTDKATLVAFYLRGRSLQQMSREFATPIGTIKRRLHVARKRLRQRLEQVTPEAPVEAGSNFREEEQELACV